MPLIAPLRRAALIACVLCGWPMQGVAQTTTAPPESDRLRVFLDCDFCFEDFIRDEVDIVEYVRDPAEADIHVLVTQSDTGGGGTERTVRLVGLGPFKGVEYSLRALSDSSDTEDTERERLATAITVGLLTYLSRDGVTGDFAVEASHSQQVSVVAAGRDPWKGWVFTIGGDVSLDGEESQRETNVQGEFGADRITNDWKITVGAFVDYTREDFDLDEGAPLRAVRNERELNWLVVKSLDDHWSLGAKGETSRSSFENIDLSVAAGPGIEYNLFPYSAYSRRQLRINYFIGPYRADYSEETLFGRTEETLTKQAAALQLEQVEPWGSLEVDFEASNDLPGWSRHRLELDAEMNVRIARGLSLSVEGSASRLRDQLSLPRRGATPEEVLLDLRRLQSGYEYRLNVGLTYRFGSIFSTIVNPRFGQ
jgi:hypothetical protein